MFACIFQNLDEWSFDVFAVSEAGDTHALKYVGYELLQRYDIIAKFKVYIVITSYLSLFKLKQKYPDFSMYLYLARIKEYYICKFLIKRALSKYKHTYMPSQKSVVF